MTIAKFWRSCVYNIKDVSVFGYLFKSKYCFACSKIISRPHNGTIVNEHTHTHTSFTDLDAISLRIFPYKLTRTVSFGVFKCNLRFEQKDKTSTYKCPNSVYVADVVCLSGLEDLAKYYWEHNTAAVAVCCRDTENWFLLQTTTSKAGSIMSGPVLIKYTTKQRYIIYYYCILYIQAR